MLPRVGDKFLSYINCINLHSHQQTQEHLSSCLLSALGCYPREVEVCIWVVIFASSQGPFFIFLPLFFPNVDYFSYFLFTKCCVYIWEN